MKEAEICGIKHQSDAFLLARSAGRAAGRSATEKSEEGCQTRNKKGREGAVWEREEGRGVRRQVERGN